MFTRILRSEGLFIFWRLLKASIQSFEQFFKQLLLLRPPRLNRTAVNVWRYGAACGAGG